MGPYDRYVAAHRAGRVSDARAAEARADDARTVAERVAAGLVHRFGVSRVILFGSLAKGGFGPRSDIDLAVLGLADGALVAAEVFANDESPYEVSLVRIEDAEPHIRAAIDREGVVLCPR